MPREAQEIKWVRANRLRDFPMPPADEPLISHLADLFEAGTSVASSRSIRRFWADERGATAIEYGLICAMIAVVVVAIAGVGGALTAIYERVSRHHRRARRRLSNSG